MKAITEKEIGVIMGSNSDKPIMQHAVDILEKFNIKYEWEIVSAHRTPDLLYNYAQSAQERGLKAIIAGAGGAAHLPGMCAAMTILPVFGVPINTQSLNGVDSLLSICQMPSGIPVGTLAIGKSGAINAALMTISILALNNKTLEKKLIEFRQNQADKIKQLSPLD